MIERLTAIPKAFYSRALYARVAGVWTGLALGYLGLLLAILWGVTAVAAGWFVNATLQDPALDVVVAEIPHVVVEHGVATADVDQPYTLRLPNGEHLATIDTSGLLATPETGLYVWKASWAIRGGSGSTRTTTYNPDARFEIDAERVRPWVDFARRWAPGLIVGGIFLIGTTLSFVYRCFVALVLAVSAGAMASTQGIELSMRARYRLAVVAMTPGLVLDAFGFFVARPLQSAWWAALVFGVLNLWMVWFAVRSCAARPLATDPPEL